MKRDRLLFIMPHDSCGGMPAYVLKQIEQFKGWMDIQVVVYEDVHGGTFATHRNKIKELVKVDILGSNKGVLNKIIKDFKATIVHVHEIPDTFMSEDMLDYLFRPSRSYSIIVTSHGSQTNPFAMKYYPDRFACVSKWELEKFSKTEVECGLWEYPIEFNTISWYEKEEAKARLRFSYKKAILCVALFTEGKNQRELFEVARMIPEYDFHFVGNQAGNFQDYWKPLMTNKPDNCIIWGERSDVDEFYKAADCFYFPSRLELMPLSVKEAIGWNLPVFCYDLPTYKGEFDLESVIYLNDLSLEQKVNLLKKL